MALLLGGWGFYQQRLPGEAAAGQSAAVWEPAGISRDRLGGGKPASAISWCGHSGRFPETRRLARGFATFSEGISLTPSPWEQGYWCPGWESNPHEEKSPEDFKSSASAIPPPGHRHFKFNQHKHLLQHDRLTSRLLEGRGVCTGVSGAFRGCIKTLDRG